MSGRALILTYHAIERGPAPLFIEPALFRAHLDSLVDSSTRVVTLDRLAADLSAGKLTERCVAITFDDGFRSVAEHAVPLLVERRMPATIFSVAGHLGGRNDWPTDPLGTPQRPLADAPALADLVRHGFDIGSHGMAHVPLIGATDTLLRRELVDSKLILERAIGAPVRWFAYPYGALPDAHVRSLLEESYVGACAGDLQRVSSGADVLALPRVDAHYLRDPRLFRRTIDGLDAYLQLRRAGHRARRLFRKDFCAVAGA
jgi:peptidoglycan/xylan/chitin deacetylase (PgdA/CDA1 family)